MRGSGTKDGQRGDRFQRETSRAKTYLSLIRMVAHDLRNPVSGILAASQCLLEDAALFLDRPHITLLRAIESSSDLLLQLIEDMEARADSERLSLRLRSTDVTKLVQHSLGSQQGQAAARNIRLNITSDPQIPTIDADTPRLGWALNALLSNTIRASESGAEIEIHVASRRKNVLIVVRHARGGSFTRTTDVHGVAAKQQRQQASALVVSTARLIVERHGGAIRVDHRTTPPTFTLILPKPEARKGEGVPLRRAASRG